MNCIHCGQPMRADAKFCKRCGQPLVAQTDERSAGSTPPAGDRILAELGFPADYDFPVPPPTSPIAAYQLSLIYADMELQAAHWDEAIAAVTPVLDEVMLRQNARGALILAAAYYLRGLAYERKGNPTKAQSDFTRALELVPTYRAAAQAREHVRPVMQSEPERRRTLNDIADQYLRGELEPSHAELLVYVREHPTEARAWVILGNVCEDLGQLEEAEQAYSKAIELDPGAYQAYTGLGVLCRRRRDYGRAAEYYDRAIAINPSYAQAYSSRAIIALKRGHDRHALELAQRAYALDKRDPVIAANLATMYHYNGMVAERDQLYEAARQLRYRDLQKLDRIFSGELTLRD